MKGEERRIAYLMKQAEEMGVNLHPFQVIHTAEAKNFHRDANSKFSILNLTDYDRIVYMDSDAMAYQHMDDHFLLPSAPIALPRAYWYPEPNYLTSAYMVIEPSDFLHQQALDRMPGGPKYSKGNNADMDIMQDMADGWAMLLPHRGLFMLSMDLRDGPEDPKHDRYLRSSQSGGTWDPEYEVANTRLIHFSEKGPKHWQGHGRMDYLCGKRQDAGCKAWRKLLNEYLEEISAVCDVP